MFKRIPWFINNKTAIKVINIWIDPFVNCV